MKRTPLIGLAFLAISSMLVACGGGGGGSSSGGGGGGTPTTVATQYRVVAVPILTGGENSATSVNRAGQVIGTSGPAGAERAYYWDATNGLISLHGAGNPADATSFGLGISPRGDACGLLVAPSFGFSRGFFANQAGGGFVVGNGDIDSAWSTANAMNNAGAIAGSRGSSFDTRYPYVFLAGAGSGAVNIGGSVNREGDVTDINETNDIVGYAEDNGGARNIAFFRQSGGTAVIFASPNAGEDQSFAALNGARNACGTRGTQAIFMAAGSQPTVIGGLTGATLTEAHDISDGNIVVGHSNFGTLDRAFAWTATDGMVNLQTRLDSTGAGWVLNRANGVSGDGRICGVGTLNGVTRAFVLIPR